MIKIFVDDVRSAPNGFIHFYTVSDTVGFIRRMYKSGNTDFYLSLDHDAGDYALDYINILKQLEDMRHCGKLNHIKLDVHFHSMNVVGVMNMRAIVNANRDWMKEV